MCRHSGELEEACGAVVSRGSMPDDLASFWGGQRGHGWVNWVMGTNGLRRFDVVRAADLLSGPVTLQRDFSAT